jgi:hypothetical protein
MYVCMYECASTPEAAHARTLVGKPKLNITNAKQKHHMLNGLIPKTTGPRRPPSPLSLPARRCAVCVCTCMYRVRRRIYLSQRRGDETVEALVDFSMGWE